MKRYFSPSDLSELPEHATSEALGNMIGADCYTMWRWRRDGLPGVKIPGGRYIIFKDEFIEWLKRTGRLVIPKPKMKRRVKPSRYSTKPKADQFVSSADRTST